MSVRGVVPRIFTRVHSGRHTLIVADHLHDRAGDAAGSLGDLSELAGTTTTLLLFVFAIVNVAVLVLRPDLGTHPHFRAPSVILVASVVIIIFLLVRRASDTP